MDSIKGWEASFGMAWNTEHSAMPLRKVGDSEDEDENFLDIAENLFFLLNDNEDSWYAIYAPEGGYAVIEEFIEENPEFVNIYYSDESAILWNPEKYEETYRERVGDYDDAWEFLVEETINKEESVNDDDSLIPLDFIYNGEVIFTKKI